MSHSDHHHHAHGGSCCSAKGASPAANAVIRDPVCGMMVDAAAGKPTAEHGGRTLHFCSERCRTKFVAEPQSYLTATDPALVQQVSETTLYRHAARSIKWAIFGFIAGLVLLVATFTKVLVLGFVGFLVMLACLLVIERNARKLGKAGMDNLTSSFREGSVGGFFGSAGRRMRDRWRRDDSV